MDEQEKKDEVVVSEKVPTDVTPNEKGAIGTPLAIVIAGVIIAVAIVFSGGNTPDVTGITGNDTGTVPSGPTQKEFAKLVEIQKDDHVRGDRNADVYILEFSDTECPFCRQFHETMKQVTLEYPNVAWVYRHFPLESLHPTAPREAEALECANELGGPDVFWLYTDTVYDRTPQGAALTDTNLSDFAVELGLSRAKFDECLNSGKYTDEVNKDLQNAIDTGGRGTPHSFIIKGDQIAPINGAQPYSIVKSTLEAVIAK